MITPAMRRLLDEQRLGFVATVDADGTPNLSPKGTVAAIDEHRLAFAHICSPGTVANVEAGRTAVAVNVVDPLTRRGYRFAGHATVHRDDTDLLAFYRDRSPAIADRIQAIVTIEVTSVAEVISPAYDDGATEDEIVARSLARLGLCRVTATPDPPT